MTNFLDSTGSTAAVITSDGYETLLDTFDIKSEIDSLLGIPWSFIVVGGNLSVTAISPADGYAASYQFGFGLSSISYPELSFIETSLPSDIIHLEDEVLGWTVSLSTDGLGALLISVQGNDGRTIYWRSVLKLNIDVTQIPS